MDGSVTFSRYLVSWILFSSLCIHVNRTFWPVLRHTFLQQWCHMPHRLLLSCDRANKALKRLLVRSAWYRKRGFGFVVNTSAHRNMQAAPKLDDVRCVNRWLTSYRPIASWYWPDVGHSGKCLPIFWPHTLKTVQIRICFTHRQVQW